MKRMIKGYVLGIVLLLNVLPSTVDASIGQMCKKLGETKQSVIKSKIVNLKCSSQGKKKVWKQLTGDTTYGAKVLESSAAKFVNMAIAVRSQEAQCMLVMKNGKVIAEWHWDSYSANTNIEIASATKSFASTLIGIAIRKGVFGLDDLASRYITEWIGTPKQNITIRHLLAMTSGLEDFSVSNPAINLTTPGLNLESLVTNASQLAVGGTYSGARRYVLPGKTWSYINVNTMSLSILLKRATGETVQSFAQRELFLPLGMTIDMTLDANNNPPLAVGMRAGCDDVGRLVQLYLNAGEWNGLQILTASFVKDAVSPQVTCGECINIPNTFDVSLMNGAYGLNWWNNAVSPYAAAAFGTEKTGPKMPDLPTDMFYAYGSCQQLGAGLPTQQLVVVVLRKGCDDPVQANLYATNTGPGSTFMDELTKAYK